MSKLKELSKFGVSHLLAVCWDSWFGHISNAAYQSRISISIIETYSIDNINLLALKTSKYYILCPLRIYHKSMKKQGKSEGFDSCDRPSNLTQIGFNHRFFNPCDLEIWWMTLKNYRAAFLHHIKLCASFQRHRLGKNQQFFVPCYLEIWWMTLKNNRAPLLC